MIDRLIAIQKKYVYRETCKEQSLLLKIFTKKDAKPLGSAEAKKEI